MQDSPVAYPPPAHCASAGPAKSTESSDVSSRLVRSALRSVRRTTFPKQSTLLPLHGLLVRAAFVVGLVVDLDPGTGREERVEDDRVRAGYALR